jgi:hypothetical protein
MRGVFSLWVKTGHWRKREQIAELLFSTDTDENQNPKGIGLSGWRFNIGGGSAEQGVASEIGDEWRRAECFLNPDGTYNWSKQGGAAMVPEKCNCLWCKSYYCFCEQPRRYIIQKMARPGPGGGNSTNLSGDNYSAFAQFLATVIDEVETREQVEIDYVSPVNEPQWDWDNKGQEGSPYTNSEIADVTKEVVIAIDK